MIHSEPIVSNKPLYTRYKLINIIVLNKYNSKCFRKVINKTNSISKEIIHYSIIFKLIIDPPLDRNRYSITY